MKKRWIPMMMALLLSGCTIVDSGNGNNTADTDKTKDDNTGGNTDKDDGSKKENPTKTYGTLTQTKTAALLRQANDTLDLTTCYTLEKGDKSDVTYAVSDSTVAEVSTAGILTAKKEGTTTATITYNSKDYEVAICVCDYVGSYGATKTISAMNWTMKIQIDVYANGNFDYYRNGMSNNGGADATEISGTYTISENEFSFVFEEDYSDYGFYDFTLEFTLDSTSGAMLSGVVPTGGAQSDLDFLLGVVVKE